MDFQTLRFVAIAAVLYGLMHFGYHNVPDDVLRKQIYPTVIGNPAVKVINTLTPERRARVSDNRISSNKAALNIVRGCDGSGILFMIVAAVLGFGARFTDPIIGLAVGLLTVYSCNQFRGSRLF